MMMEINIFTIKINIYIYTIEQIKELSIQLGDNLPDDQIKTFCDINNRQDEITEEEFIRLMNQSFLV